MTAFSLEAFLSALRGAGGSTDRDVRVHDVLDSTSSELVRLLAAGAPPGTAVVAERQRAGRGRRGRSWFSPAVGNLYISLAVDCGERLERITRVPLAAGVAAVDAVAERCAPVPSLKWPNDLLVNDRKVGGILCEVSDPRARPGSVVVGLGLNLGVFEPPAELDGLAASLAIKEREAVAGEWAAGLERWVDRLRDPGQAAGLVQAWRARAEPFGRRVELDGASGVTVDLDSAGRLLVERDDGMVVAVVGGIVENVAATTPV
jgi:BirA family biotin operon repressor/biotin-[acetyl-CoA-carboxylase] ligase